MNWQKISNGNPVWVGSETDRSPNAEERLASEADQKMRHDKTEKFRRAQRWSIIATIVWIATRNYRVAANSRRDTYSSAEIGISIRKALGEPIRQEIGDAWSVLQSAMADRRISALGNLTRRHALGSGHQHTSLGLEFPPPDQPGYILSQMFVEGPNDNAVLVPDQYKLASEYLEWSDLTLSRVKVLELWPEETESVADVDLEAPEGVFRKQAQDLVKIGRVSPQEAEAEAQRRGLSPFVSHMDAAEVKLAEELDWSIAMAIEWTATRCDLSVARLTKQYSRGNTDWIPYDSLPPGLRDGRPPNGFLLKAADISRSESDLEVIDAEDIRKGRRLEMSRQSARLELWAALRSGGISATGTRNDEDQVIPAIAWRTFKPGDSCAWQDIKILATDLRNRWPREDAVPIKPLVADTPRAKESAAAEALSKLGWLLRPRLSKSEKNKVRDWINANRPDDLPATAQALAKAIERARMAARSE